MDSAGWITVITLVLSVTSVVLTGLFSIRTARLGHQLEAEREQRHQEQSAIKAAERVYEPLAQAAAELQSRIFNIVETGWVPLMKRYESHGDYAVTSTAFLFAHYFGWIEARRQAVLASSGEGGRDVSVQRHIDGVLKVLRRSEDSEGFLFFTTEQRAIGELMLSWDVFEETGTRIPNVAGLRRVRRALPQRRGLPQLVRADQQRHGPRLEGRQPPAGRHPARAGRADRRARPEAQVHRRATTSQPIELERRSARA